MEFKLKGSGPLYLRIRNEIYSKIAEGEYKTGDLLPSESKLAVAIGVSRLTVRKAYRLLNDKGIISAHMGSGWYVNKDISRIIEQSHDKPGLKSSRKIGLIAPDVTVFSYPIIMVLEEELSKKNYDLIIKVNDTTAKERTAIESLIDSRVDGIIIIPLRGVEQQDRINYEMLMKSHVPVVFIGVPPFHVHADSVYCNDIDISIKAVQRLIDSKNRRIVYVFSDYGDIEARLEREEGYRFAMQTYAPDLPMVMINISNPDAYEKLDNLFEQHERRIAFFCCDDNIAVDVMRHSLYHDKKIPQDVEIIGFGDFEQCYNAPIKLTTISSPRAQLGAKALELLLRKIQGDHNEKEVTHIQLLEKLIRRKSTKNF